jgi:hypothetical protein
MQHMSKLNNLVPAIVLAPFAQVMGEPHFTKVCADVASNLGRLEKDIITKSGGWKNGARGAIVSKDGHKLQLPLNAPWASLIRFGLQLTEIATNGSSLEPVYKMEIHAELPAVCANWFETNYRGKPVVKETVDA